jgi:uncharacterized coiled-coil protein SlyX
MNEQEPSALFAAQQHLQTVKVQAIIILAQQKEIERLNAQLIKQVDESTLLRRHLAALEDRLDHPGAPMNQSTGMRCPTCCAKQGEPHVAGCTNDPKREGSC